MRKTRAALLLSPLLLTALACAPQDDSGSSSASSGSSSSASAGSCATGDLALKQAGQLTIATDTPAYDPWFADNDPTNGKGFESAVAYAVAQQLGFDRDQVTWVKQPFNSSYAPGAKKWDFDINQVSITPERQRVVDFSTGYYSAAQAVVALDDSKLTPGSMADLKGLKLGAQTGTTSLTAIRDVIEPDQAPLVFNNTNTAKQALLNGQVDAIVTDLPTAFYVTAAEIEGSEIIGQFQPVSGETEEFGLLLEKGSELTPCVDEALTALEDDGTLAGLEQKWLSTSVDVPVLK
ncbi:amino acid ABC transporter substrate-binding protein, PAAT family [Nocardioides scoriae]|uniref:Amino acid ABC transporter substrate-binding protein, PAAT family n=1 Tax=Nocardioides scoriae TaxID=642780 RepID=A0A1H1W0J3_9ACTN|nr:ABC transporter substrate-binding protein [Nocardioides scoriae]SDS90637.1 amino acid ABC transporter substrate-binding protein, PAAT family [Nocardioides scoriae]